MSRGPRILGLGSPHGDDRAGWRLIQMLEGQLPANARAIAIKAPIELLDHLAACERLIVVDACRTGRTPGTVTRIEWPDDRISVHHHRGTHNLDLDRALRLARQLDKLPTEVILFGIEIEACRPGTSLSGKVEQALDDLRRQVLDLCSRGSS